MYSVKYKIILLNNRKSGSTSLRHILKEADNDVKKIDLTQDLTPIEKRNHFLKNSYKCHINVNKLFEYFKINNMNIKDYDIITTIRDPIEKAISSYYYYKPDRNLKLFTELNYDKKSKFYYDINTYILKGGYIGESILDFAFINGEKKVTHIFDINNNELINEYFKSKNINIKLKHKNISKKNNNIKINEIAENYIRKKFYYDFYLINENKY